MFDITEKNSDIVPMENVELIRNAIKQSIPQLSINCVIFRFYHQKLQIPVVQPLSSEVRVIPGGYIYQNEGIDEAARRIVYEQTQIEEPFLNQFGSFGAASRDFEKEFQSISNAQIPTDILQWLSQRFVTIGYYSIVGNQEVEVKTNLFFKNVEWMDVDKAESLALDHSLLLSEAKTVMARDLLSQPLLMNFFPDVLTLPELQKLY